MLVDIIKVFIKFTSIINMEVLNFKTKEIKNMLWHIVYTVTSSLVLVLYISRCDNNYVLEF